MSVTITEDYFSRDSNSRILVGEFKRVGKDAVVRHTVRHFLRYTEGLSQIVNLDQPTRNEVLQLWFNDNAIKADDKLKPEYERLGLPYREYQDIMMRRLRAARQHGAILEKIRA